jgi:hypothetical protein
MPSLPGRLLRLELRRNALLWMLPLAAVLFWFDTYRTTMGFPPLWSLRGMIMQQHAVVDFAPFVAGVAAWMGSRDARRRTTDLVAVAARPRWANQLATWTATTCWAVAAYLGGVAAVYGGTAHQATWGGPLWWPVAVGAAGVAAVCALGFTAGAYFPSRFTAPLAAFVVFLALVVAFKSDLSNGSVFALSPQNTSVGYVPSTDIGTFYSYLPDLSIVQVMFLAGLTTTALGGLGLSAASGGLRLRRSAAAVTMAGLVAAGTGLGLVGTARLEASGMLAIPALHDAASDRLVPYTPICSNAAVPVCLHPAYGAYLPDVTASLGPVLSEVAGLPGAPVRIGQVVYLKQGLTFTGGGVTISGSPPVLRIPLGFYLPASAPLKILRWKAAPVIVSHVIGGATSASPAQQSVEAALLQAADVPLARLSSIGTAFSAPAPGSSVYAAAQRFAALPPAARHAWLATHLAALRAGHVTLAQLP